MGWGGSWLENVHMAGRNGGVLIACLQISCRLPSVPQSALHRYRMQGKRSEAGASPPPRLGQLIIGRGPLKTSPLGRMSAPVLFVWTLWSLGCARCQQIIYVALLMISHFLRWSGGLGGGG